MKTSTAPFNDARSCKEWLKSIPLTNVTGAQQSVVDALCIANADKDFDPLERLTCLEIVRDRAAHFLTVQRARFVGKVLPLATTEQVTWDATVGLFTQMGFGYRLCWEHASSVDSTLAPHAALILQRIISYIGMELAAATDIYRRLDGAKWMQLHLHWMEAETRGLTERSVKDSINGDEEGRSSVLYAYVGAILRELARCDQLTPRQIEFVTVVVKRFALKTAVTVPSGTAFLNEEGRKSCVIDLFAKAAATIQVAPPRAEHLRVLDTSVIDNSLRRRIKKLGEGELPGALALPADWSATEAREQLLRLRALWCTGLHTPLPESPKDPEVNVSCGLAESHYMVAGDIFRQPDAVDQLSRKEIGDLRLYGTVSAMTKTAQMASVPYGAETWVMIDETRDGMRLMRPVSASRRLMMGSLVCVRVGRRGPRQLAYVSAIVEDVPGEFIFSISLLPGFPEASAVRAVDLGKRGASSYTQALVLPPLPALNIPQSVIVPCEFAKKGAEIDVCPKGTRKPTRVLLADILFRGADFDRIAVA